MSKVIRISDKTISVLNHYREYKVRQYDDPLIKKGFFEMSDDDMIRFVFEKVYEEECRT